jgi:hypothetical protein
MRTLKQWYGLAGVVAAVSFAGCKSLEVTNPNAPDAARAFSDPAAVAGLISGAFHNWVGQRGSYYGVGNLIGMAESYTSSWNNGQYRYYNSIGPVGFFQSNCVHRCGWFNSSSDAKKNPIEAGWYGYYSMLSSVNDVLTAIRKNHLVLSDDATTKQYEAIAVMLEGVVFSNIALNYDKGFYVTDSTDISNPGAIPFRPRAELRDSAISTFDKAVALLTATPFASSPTIWAGVPGVSYSSDQWIKLIRTMQAELLAYYPRDAAENDQVNWAQVATYASEGLSSGSSFDFNVFQDRSTINDFQKLCSVNCLFRIHSKVANLVTGGYPPALGTGPVYATPYPGTPEPQPNSADHRVGDGSWGPSDNFNGAATVAATANAGTDFAWSPQEVFRAVRGAYHQSSMLHIRYSYLAYSGSGLPSEDSHGLDPVYPATFNDLLWAEGLLRSGGNPVTAATLINKTRVGRGHLAPLTGAEGTATLIRALEYEQEVELLGISASAFFNRRRGTPEGWVQGTACPAINCLWQDTPRQMPIPAQELSVLGQPIYTFGGDQPDEAPSFAISGTGRVAWKPTTRPALTRLVQPIGFQLKQ